MEGETYACGCMYVMEGKVEGEQLVKELKTRGSAVGQGWLTRICSGENGLR
jgi:hypothetical protein